MKWIVATMLASCLLYGCSTGNSLTTYYNHKTQIIRTEADGNCIVTAWGQGKCRSEAKREAKKRAVHDILFSYIETGKGSQMPLPPLLAAPDAKERHRKYFLQFFEDNGLYKNFCKEETRRPAGESYYKNETQITCKIILKVKREELRERMSADGIASRQDKNQ